MPGAPTNSIHISGNATATVSVNRTPGHWCSPFSSLLHNDVVCTKAFSCSVCASVSSMQHRHVRCIPRSETCWLILTRGAPIIGRLFILHRPLNTGMGCAGP